MSANVQSGMYMCVTHSHLTLTRKLNDSLKHANCIIVINSILKFSKQIGTHPKLFSICNFAPSGARVLCGSLRVLCTIVCLNVFLKRAGSLGLIGQSPISFSEFWSHGEGEYGFAVASRQSRQQLSSSTVSTVSTALDTTDHCTTLDSLDSLDSAVKLSSSTLPRHSLDTCRHLSTLVDTCRQSRQSRQPGLRFLCFQAVPRGSGWAVLNELLTSDLHLGRRSTCPAGRASPLESGRAPSTNAPRPRKWMY